MMKLELTLMTLAQECNGYNSEPHYFKIEPLDNGIDYHEDTEINKVLAIKHKRNNLKKLIQLLKKVCEKHTNISSLLRVYNVSLHTHYSTHSSTIEIATFNEDITENHVVLLHLGNGKDYYNDNNLLMLLSEFKKVGYVCEIEQQTHRSTNGSRDYNSYMLSVSNSSELKAHDDSELKNVFPNYSTICKVNEQLQIIENNTSENKKDINVLEADFDKMHTHLLDITTKIKTIEEQMSVDNIQLIQEQLDVLQERIHSLELETSACKLDETTISSILDSSEEVTLTTENTLQEAINFHKQHNLTNNDLVETIQAMLESNLYILDQEITNNKIDFTQANTLFLAGVAPSQLNKNDLQNLIFKNIVCEDLI